MIRASTLCGVVVSMLCLASEASADCKARLEAVDAKLAEARDLDPQLRQALTTFRDQGAAHCAAGNETSAGASFTSVEMMLSTTAQMKSQRQAEAARTAASRAKLSPSYMAGTWCSVAPGNNERVLWVFAPDGSYESAPSEFRFAFVGKGSFDEFLEEVESVTEQGPDRFVTPENGRVFQRGRGICHGDDGPPPR